MNPDDTIAAIATPPGVGGLAVVRVSGREALAVADRVFAPAGRAAPKPSAATSHTIHYGRIVRNGRAVDEVLLAVLRAPRTFTREDTVEVSCHGGMLPARLVLDTLLEAGARLARPGEFTQRAFLNGRLDLAQAEAVADVIHSRTELALAAAGAQLNGRLSRAVHRLRDDLMRVLAHVEAHIDFPEEDIAPDTREQLLARLDATADGIEQLLRTAGEGRLLRHGVRVAIIGRPNVGKSSLLNQLLGQDRAIVAPTPGTTRDTIEETASLHGLPVVFVDTAGLRAAGDSVEEEGIRRSRQAGAGAELILLVCDVSEPLQSGEAEAWGQFADRKRVLVCNKTDLPERLKLPELAGVPVVRVSCRTGAGMDELRNAIRASVWTGGAEATAPEITINSRHQEALQRALPGVRQATAALRADASLDLVAVDLRQAVNAVGEVTGQTATDDLLDIVFREFCLGK